MAMSVRTFLKSVAALAIAAAGGSVRAQERLTLSAFIARVRSDTTLRTRFADNPRAVLSDYGIDASPYNLPDHVTAAQMDKLLDDLSRIAAAEPPPAVRPGPPPAPVYGPPPVAVYGPAPGMRRP